MTSFDTTILNGFPVTVEYDICSPDYSSYSEYAEVTGVTLITGKDASFVTGKMSKTQWIKLESEADDHLYGVTPKGN